MRSGYRRGWIRSNTSIQDMNSNSINGIEIEDAGDTRPILVIPYMWIGDFVRGHTVVRVLKRRWPKSAG